MNPEIPWLSTQIDTEVKVQKSLQEREGGRTEVETPIGFVDLVTEEHAIEIKHVTNWKDGLKILAYNIYLSDRKPRIHLFGSYTDAFRKLVEATLKKLKIMVTWEEEPY